ncbi:MAG: HlyD family efflux transporter periplasmic adaptor subunit [bacterium]
MARLRPVLIFVVLAGLIFLISRNAAYFTGGPRPDPHTIRLSGSIEVTRIDLAARADGRVAAIPVTEGSTVKQGDVLIRLENPSLAAQAAVLAAQRAQAQATYDDLADGTRPEEIAQARAGVKAAQARLQLLEAGPRPQESAVAKNQVGVAQEAFDQATEAANRARRLYDEGVIAAEERETAEHAEARAADQLKTATEQASLVDAGARDQERAIARAQVQQSQAGLELLEAGATPETIARAAAAIDTVDAQMGVLQADLGELEVRAPIPGVVDQILREPGELVAPGQTIASLRNPDDVILRAYLPEPDLAFVRIGQDATILMPDGTTIPGTVHTIASEAEFTPRNIQTPEERATQVFAIEIAITDPPPYLRDGMTVDVTLTRQAAGSGA